MPAMFSDLKCMEANYDAVLLISFGGPEKMEDIVPFLANITAGKNIPLERILKVGRQYELFGGVSPINGYCRTLIAALRAELLAAGADLPVYWGNRNWHPLLSDTVSQMTKDGVTRSVAFVTSAYSSYSSCRQYVENIEYARQAAGPNAPLIQKIGPYFGHAKFVQANTEHMLAALSRVPEHRRSDATILFSAHSIPIAMAANCAYESQLLDACRSVACKAGLGNWNLVFQSRSGDPPAEPWLAPDINDHIRELANTGVRDVVVLPIGFICDHMEIIYSLDVEAAQLAHTYGINFVRAATVGTNRIFVHMVRDLVLEHISRGFNGSVGLCGSQCCPSGNLCVLHRGMGRTAVAMPLSN